MSYKVRLAAFEGPFDLLVYLIENAQMSIYDIQISEITSQYLRYIGEMQKQNISLSTEFMVLAAELIQIKSRMMLPQEETPGAPGAAEDPRTELALRLAEYKKVRVAADMLSEREEEESRRLEKPQEDISLYTDHPDEYLKLGVDEFARAFRAFLYKKKKIEDTRRHYSFVEKERETMENRMRYIIDIFRRFKKGSGEASGNGSGQGVDFRELVPSEHDRYDVVVSFASLLQLMRQRFLDAEQDGLYGRILVRTGVRDLSEAENLEEDG